MKLPSLAGLFVALLLLCLTRLCLAQSDPFSNANAKYAAGNFKEAIAQYEELARAGETSAALFYNLGNAYYRADDLGRAILNYERALALEPHHPEAEANLRQVRDKARALELKRRPLDRLTSQITATQLSVTAAISFWLAAFALAALFFARRRPAALTAVMIVSVLLLAGAIYSLYSLETGTHGNALAIITAKSTDARLATADNAGTVLTLPPGSQVQILSTRGDWSYAALPNDLRGWIPAANAERVRL